MTGKRVLLYSHDTFGLGHIRRTQKIANRLGSEGHTVLIVCSSPCAQKFEIQEKVDFLIIPGFQKQDDGSYRPRKLGTSYQELVDIRCEIFRSAFQNFLPDLVIVDKEPLGVGGELRVALEELRERSSCKVICGFRDILDSPERVASEWNEKAIGKALDELYDHFFIYGEKQIYPFEDMYQFSPTQKEKVHYTGYITPNCVSGTGMTGQRPLVTMTLGGGGDGWHSLNSFLEIIEKEQDQLDFDVFVLTGPFCDLGLMERCERLQRKYSFFTWSSFLSDPIKQYEKSELVIAMGGYNTVTEVLSLKKKMIIIPREYPRKEQLIRAQILAEKGFCDLIGPDEMNAGLLQEKITYHLCHDALRPMTFKNNGLDSISLFIHKLFF